MKLTYRGVPYEASFSSELTAELKQPARSRRSVTQQQRSTRKRLRCPGNELTYRGVRYQP